MTLTKKLIGSAAVLMFCLFLSGGMAAQAQDNEGEAWNVRCQEAESGEERCEAYQSLVMKEGNQRLLEFAIGYPPEGENARGVMILPNGILLEPGVKMQVDDNQSFAFKVRYCLNDGCYAFLNLNDKVLKMMKKGVEAKVSFLTLEGREVTIPMSLMGFTKAMRKIK